MGDGTGLLFECDDDGRGWELKEVVALLVGGAAEGPG